MMNCCCFTIKKKVKKDDSADAFDKNSSRVNIISTNDIGNSKEENPTGQ